MASQSTLRGVRDVVAQQLAERLVRNPEVLVATAKKDQHPPLVSSSGGFGDEGRFPLARLPRNQHGTAALTGLRHLGSFVQRRQLVGPADQPDIGTVAETGRKGTPPCSSASPPSGSQTTS